MNKGTHYGAYNARWLSPEEVASTFVPLSSFYQLVRSGHSVLLGPRGCGKTTLLKMLTRRALKTWSTAGREEEFGSAFAIPEYEAIYIPSDVRWSYEIRDICNLESLDPNIAELTQRVMITASVVQQVIDAARSLVNGLPLSAVERDDIETEISKDFINVFEIPRIIPSFSEVEGKINSLEATLRGVINWNDSKILQGFLGKLPPIFYSHSIDAPTQCCRRINARLPEHLKPKKWALCYDELEIAPHWLHKELLSSLRSIDQGFYLKLTWNPILPKATTTAPEPTGDFTVIRLWSSHIHDPVPFCERLTKSFLQRRFPNHSLTPDSFLGHSVFVSESMQSEEKEYRDGSIVYKAMKSLAQKDRAFRQDLLSRSISPDDPRPADDPILREKQMNEFFRKAKPIVLLRDAYLKATGKRSRKSPQLYAGKEAIYAVSEGNPRWLLGLLNDLCDTSDLSRRSQHRHLKVHPSDQAKIINGASKRFIALVRATPIARDSHGNDLSLQGLVKNMADIMYDALYDPTRFQLDPIGSIKIKDRIPPHTESVIIRALEMGALVHMGKQAFDVPTQIVGERFRLSFMICPYYKLPLRNYRSLSMSSNGFLEDQGVYHESHSGIRQLLLEFANHEDR